MSNLLIISSFWETFSCKLLGDLFGSPFLFNEVFLYLLKKNSWSYPLALWKGESVMETVIFFVQDGVGDSLID